MEIFLQAALDQAKAGLDRPFSGPNAYLRSRVI
jgi:hypothetical protein